MNTENNEELNTQDDDVITDADYELDTGDDDDETLDTDESDGEGTDADEGDDDTDEKEGEEGKGQDDEQDGGAEEEQAKTFIPQEVLDQHPEVKNRISSDYNKIRELEANLAKERRKNLEQRKEVHTKSKPEEVPKPDRQLAYDSPEEYDSQMEAHYESKEAIKNWEQENQSIQTEEQTEAQRAAALEVQTIESTFLENAAKQGVKPEQAQKTAGVVVSHLQQMNLSEQDSAKSAQLMRHVMKHPNGAKLLDHFSRKPNELSNLLSLDAFEVGQRLGEISQSFKPKTKSDAPPPDDPLPSGSTTKTDGVLAGATFE